MARIKNCKHQGFAFAKDGYKNVHIICDYDGENHKKEYCLKCENYEPRTQNTIRNGGERHESCEIGGRWNV